MEIISVNFLLYTAIVILVYYCLERRAQNIWLGLASIFFIISWNWIHLIPLFIIAGVSFLSGRKLDGEKGQTFLAAGIVFNFTVLAAYRVVASPLFAISTREPGDLIRQLLVPLGLSFYVLQAISYLIDVRKGKLKAETDPIDFLVYLMYFPKFLAGPIERAGNFLPQLKAGRFVDNEKLTNAFTLIIFGLVRKVVIAEVLLSILPAEYLHAAVVNTHPELGFWSIPFFSYIGRVAYLDRVVGLFGYGIYLYNDFAGYTSIVRGISLLMGINLSPNFQVPYFSTSLSDFWNRWHISLSSWLRDYIYFPLTRQLKKKFNKPSAVLPVVIPLMATMLLSGFWHSLSGPLLTWGLTYAVLMILEQLLFQHWPNLRPQRQPAPVRALYGLLTFLLVTLAWVPFSAGSMPEILAFGKMLFKSSGWNTPPEFSPFILILALASFTLDYLQFRDKDELFALKWPLHARALLLAVGALALFLAFTWTSPYSASVFVYQGF